MESVNSLLEAVFQKNAFSLIHSFKAEITSATESGNFRELVFALSFLRYAFQFFSSVSKASFLNAIGNLSREVFLWWKTNLMAFPARERSRGLNRIRE